MRPTRLSRPARIPSPSGFPGGLLLGVLLVLSPVVPGLVPAQEAREDPETRDQGGGGAAADLARVKQEEAREKLRDLEETMERLARLLATTEPRNAAKLRTAFQGARERLLREGMDRIITYLIEKKLQRAVADQESIVGGLEEILAILLEKDIDPRELIREIRRVRDIVQDLDRVIEEETRQKITSDQATEAGSEMEKLSSALAQLDELVRKEKEIESAVGAARKGSGTGNGPGSGGKGSEGEGGEKKDPAGEALEKRLDRLASRQEELKARTGELRKSVETAASSGSSGAAGTSSSSSSAGGGSPGAIDPRPLASAEAAMEQAAQSMQSRKTGPAARQAAEARKQLEAARGAAEEAMEKLRQKRDFAAMKKEQDGTLETTRDILERMKKSPPLTFSPEGGVPGRGDVGGASGSMEDASGSLSGGKPRPASRSQKSALDQLNRGRQQAEETLEALQRALRDRLLAYLRERFTHMAEEQKKISRETQSLDARLRALVTAAATASGDPPGKFTRDRRDLQRAKNLSRREGALRMVAEDVIDLLEEDGTTLVFPRIVGEVERDLDNVQKRLAGALTGALTQRIQKEIEETIEEILEAIRLAQASPPPPDPSRGRNSPNGTGPLLPGSAELKMIRSMQERVNKRTRDFDLDRNNPDLDLEERRQATLIAERQTEIEDLLRKIARLLGER